MTTPDTTPTNSIPLWQHKDDEGALGEIRNCAPCPAVFVLQESVVKVTKEWQFFIRAINPGMTIKQIVALFDPHKAFTNRATDDDRKNYLEGKHMDCEELTFDKVRTCALSVLTGAVNGEMLNVVVMDGNKPPPLKPGRSQPQKVAEIKLDDYLYTPQTHRHLFFAANIVRADGKINPFPNGAVYSWTGDGKPYTWLPHVSRFSVQYPLSNLTQLPAGPSIPSPYQ
jgi:hypothetical protein